MLYPSRRFVPRGGISFSLICVMFASSLALAQTAPEAGSDEAVKAEKAKANVEAATVNPDADKECVTDDPADVAKRAEAHATSDFMNLTSQMIEDAHTSCDVFWDKRDDEFKRSVQAKIDALNTWPGPWTQPAVLELERMMPESSDRDFIPQERCKAAAKADALFCESVQHPVVRPFCNSWLKLKRGAPLDISACETFAPEQQKACSMFLGVNPKACEGVEGQEAFWCSFISSLKAGGLPNCSDNFTHDGCMRDVLMLTVMGGEKPCEAVRTHMKNRPQWAMNLLHAQCEAIVASKPEACPEDPKEARAQDSVGNLSDVYLRGGGDGVRPVVAVVTWSNAAPKPLAERGPKTESAPQGAMFAICATEVTALPATGEAQKSYAVTMGSAQTIHKAAGTPFSNDLDPFSAPVTAESVCAWTAPWLGRVSR